jgi:hypothetical protein
LFANEKESVAWKTNLLPENVLFDFLIANLRGSDDEIRPLIVEHTDAALLWQGAYPPDVAELLARQQVGRWRRADAKMEPVPLALCAGSADCCRSILVVH